MIKEFKMSLYYIFKDFNSYYREQNLRKNINNCNFDCNNDKNTNCIYYKKL